MAVSINKEITRLRRIPDYGNFLAEAFDRLQRAVNNLGTNIGADPAITLPSPPSVQNLTVKSNGNGLVHAVIDDQNGISRGLHYFVEYDTDPNFSKPHVKHLGPSRSMEPVTLPAMDDNGNAQNFYFRAYSQYPGGAPGPKIQFGGSTPTPVAPGGTQRMTLLPSTGSGTAQPTGQEGGSGFGKVLHRPPTTPVKR